MDHSSPHPLGVNEFRSRVVGDAVHVEPDRESINARIAFHQANRTPWYKDAWQETIKPPEFACRCVASGKVRFYTTQDGRDKCVQSAKNWQAVRIDWGAK